MRVQSKERLKIAKKLLQEHFCSNKLFSNEKERIEIDLRFAYDECGSNFHVWILFGS